MAVLDPGGTGRFASATTETAIYMSFKGQRINRETLLFDSPHQVDTPTRTVVLIAGDDISRTGFEAQPTMNAGENFFFFAGENGIQI